VAAWASVNIVAFLGVFVFSKRFTALWRERRTPHRRPLGCNPPPSAAVLHATTTVPMWRMLVMTLAVSTIASKSRHDKYVAELCDVVRLSEFQIGD